MPKDNRDIRVSGKRKDFEVGRFVLAIMVHAEALAEAEETATSTIDRSNDNVASQSSAGTNTVWQSPRKGRAASPGPAGGSDPNPSPDDEEAA